MNDGPLRIGVTGTPVVDTIVTADGVETRAMGGLYYSILALDALLPETASAIPVAVVGADVAGRVREEWGALERVDLDGLQTVGAANNAVRLEYAADGSRRETQSGALPALGWRDLAPWVERFDVWLWNLISGAETGLATFRALKAAFRGPVYLDLHSLCLDPASAGVRAPRRPPEWRSWIEGVAWLQVNEIEAGLLWSGRPEPLAPRTLARLAAQAHDLGVRELLVTRGAKGAECHVGGRVIRAAPETPVEALDPTGCGDVFGAAWCALRVVRGWEVERALEGAVRIASAAATVRGTEGLHTTLKEVDDVG